MPVLIADHHLKDFDSWFKLFTANPPPNVGQWRILRGAEDPNRVYVIGEMEASEAVGVKELFGSDKMQTAFEQVNDMSAAPLEFVWLDDVTPG